MSRIQANSSPLENNPTTEFIQGQTPVRHPIIHDIENPNGVLEMPIPFLKGTQKVSYSHFQKRTLQVWSCRAYQYKYLYIAV